MLHLPPVMEDYDIWGNKTRKIDWKPQKLQEKFRETELLNRFFLALLGGMHKERDIM